MNLDADAQITENNKATSYFEDVVFDLAHIAEGSPTSSAAGVRGDTRVDSTYLYICYDADSWGRITLSTGY
jgi:hypothetical protein